MTDHRGRRALLAIAIVSAALYALLGLAGDLRQQLPLFLAAHGVLCALMLLGWSLARHGAFPAGLVLGAALAFRLVAAAGDPALSDDVYRYVWDGKVQLHGVHPYRHAPTDAELAGLRDANWSRINHPELDTIYPPLAQMLFLGLASVGAGPVGFKLAMGLLDFVVVLLLARLLRRCGLPEDRLLLYAWNPLAVMETAGSGHVEPLGVALVLLSAAWIIDRRPGLSTLALAGAIQAKLLPVVLLPAYLRRCTWKTALLLPLAVAALLLPYAATGPALGGGGLDYASRWAHNAVVFPLIEGGLARIDIAGLLKPLLDRLLPWEFLYRHVWPRDIASLAVGVLALAWLLHLAVRRRPDPLGESLLALGGVLLLAPTLHPWYVLWVLPLAVARLSWGWLSFGALVPLAYWNDGGDVAWPVRLLEYLPPLLLVAWLRLRARRSGVTSGP